MQGLCGCLAVLFISLVSLSVMIVHSCAINLNGPSLKCENHVGLNFMKHEIVIKMGVFLFVSFLSCDKPKR